MYPKEVGRCYGNAFSERKSTECIPKKWNVVTGAFSQVKKLSKGKKLRN